MKLSDVIGQGSYGCIHKPSLHCTRKVKYDNKVSKILKSKDAIKELKEYKLISKIDKNDDYHLGIPVKCKIKKIKYNIDSIKKCKNGEEFIDEMKNIDLLVMNDGGYHLEDFVKYMNNWKVNNESREKLELFWLECHRILYGLKLLLDNNIIHHDLKPQNIVYNIKENRLNFIDFGFMTTTDYIMKKSKASNNNLATFHWSFPYELPFLNKNTFLNFCDKTDEERKEFFDNIIKSLKNKENTNVSRSMKTFFSFIVKPGLTNSEYNNFVMIFLEDYYSMLTNNFKSHDDYNLFLKKSVETIDIFGVGISFFYVLSNSIHLMNDYLINELIHLFYHMIHFNVFRRYDIDTIINEYESIMEKSGILKKYNKHFENHTLKDGPVIPEFIESKIKQLTKKDISITDEEKAAFITTTGIECSPGKEYKPDTKRCVKKCGLDQHRDITSKCKNNSLVKTQKKRY
jgi:serine/threonine protein kinase